MSKTDRRLIPRNACTWCGHPPHRATCSKSIQTSAKPLRTRPCPCARARYKEATAHGA